MSRVVKIMSRVNELQNEFIVFFTLENVTEFCELLEKFSYLSDIFLRLKQINSSMRGPNENILTSCSKLFTLKDKLKIWKNMCKKINLRCFLHYL